MANNVPNTHIQNVKFIGSYPDVSSAPKLGLPEFAFIGRSNVGKSSLINYICRRKNLARTSSTPGKTQLINLFEVESIWVLADLPGYGYAKVSKKKRQQWSRMIEDYLLNREMLFCVFILIDSRIPPQQIDLDMINWLGKNEVPFIIIFTKTDKTKHEILQQRLVEFFHELRDTWETLPHHIVTSSIKDVGRDELLEIINDAIDTYQIEPEQNTDR